MALGITQRCKGVSTEDWWGGGFGREKARPRGGGHGHLAALQHLYFHVMGERVDGGGGVTSMGSGGWIGRRVERERR